MPFFKILWLKEAALNLHFASMPAIPALNKWTKLSPCCDFYLQAALSNSLLGMMAEAAFDTDPPRGDEAPAPLDGDGDARLLEDPDGTGLSRKLAP